jgi:hypothetical protein
LWNEGNLSLFNLHEKHSERKSLKFKYEAECEEDEERFENFGRFYANGN